jgi:hypothetical protein
MTNSPKLFVESQLWSDLCLGVMLLCLGLIDLVISHLKVVASGRYCCQKQTTRNRRVLQPVEGRQLTFFPGETENAFTNNGTLKSAESHYHIQPQEPPSIGIVPRSRVLLLQLRCVTVTFVRSSSSLQKFTKIASFLIVFYSSFTLVSMHPFLHGQSIINFNGR